jgi:hypothetical protein
MNRPRAVPVPLRLLMLAAAASHSGPAQTARPGCGPAPEFRPAPNPYDFSNGDPGLRTLWSRLGIPATVRVATDRGFEQGTGEISCAAGCEARAETSGNFLLGDGNDAVVRVCNRGESACRLLLLYQGSKGWGLVDYVDSPNQRYSGPTAEVVPAADRRWLVIRGFGGGGTGCSLDVADWFEIHCGALRRVLHVPASGHDVNARPGRHFSTRFTAFRKREGRESLEFGYVVLFEDYPHLRPLWQEERTVVFSRPEGGAQFRFDAAASDITETFAAKVFDTYSMKPADFVEFAFNRLRRIATDPSDSRRTWLRGLLDETAATPKVQSLRAALATAP